MAINPEGERLAERFKAGDEMAFPELVKLWERRLFRTFYGMTRNADDALDLTQDSFLRVYKGIRRWDGRSSFSTWLNRVATNLGIDFLRKRGRSKEFSSPDAGLDVGVEDPTPLEDAEEKSVRLDRLHRAMDSLPEGQRVIMALRHYQGMSLKEIAEVRGCAVGTVKSSLFQAFRNLQKGVRADRRSESDARA
ncbi:MAG: sigma-70 family RNA polymerase sigma factor [Planctomycetota bacterium]|nr:sigma-70 family RNA polymerase sigma factor [Planctomycetota bacterium]